MKVLRDNLLIKKLSKEQLGKIILPESFQDDWLRGEVVQVGPDVKGCILPGQIAIFPPNPMGGNYPSIGEESQMVIPEKFIWAIED
jgi:co-chaperonin GroES (HSP10)